MRKFPLIVCFMIFSLVSTAQWQLTNTVKRSSIDQYTQDNAGNIYITTVSGDVIKYSQNGELLVEYSPDKIGTIHQISVLSQLKVLLFYEDFQEYVFLDRYLAAPVRYSMRDYGLGFISDITPNFQQNVWVVDLSDFTIKLLDARRNEVIERKSLAKILDQRKAEIISLTMHQNRVYLTDKNIGTLVFDNIGNYMFSMNLINDGQYRFYQDFIYFVESDKLKLKNIYSNEVTQMEMPDVKTTKILYSDNCLAVFNDTGFMIYKYLRSE